MLRLGEMDIDELRDICIFKYLQWNHIRKDILGPGKILPYKGALIEIQPGGKITVNGSLKLGTNKIKGSKAETWVRVGANASVKINGDFSVFCQNDIRVFDRGELKLGSGYINQGGVISCYKAITIGNDVKIARQVFIYDNDYHKIKNQENKVTNTPQPIMIGNHVWIGSKATILKGVTIGDGAIVAANSLVNRDVPPNCLVAGNPARVIRDNVIWE